MLVADMAVVFQYSVSIHALRAWYVCQVLVAASLVTGVEIVIMARGHSALDERPMQPPLDSVHFVQPEAMDWISLYCFSGRGDRNRCGRYGLDRTGLRVDVAVRTPTSFGALCVHYHG